MGGHLQHQIIASIALLLLTQPHKTNPSLPHRTLDKDWAPSLARMRIYNGSDILDIEDLTMQ